MLAFVFNIFKVADGSEVATIDGAAVNFLSEDGSTALPFLESNSQNATRATKLKLNEVQDKRIPGTDDGIIIQAVDEGNEESHLRELKDGNNQGTGETEQLNKNWLYISGTQLTEQGISTALEGDEEASYLIQSPENYKLNLLQTMFKKENLQKFADLVVFCCDGVAWTSKLLLSASSIMIREAFGQLDRLQNETTCLVLPDITKKEFSIFHKALFTSVNDSKLDLVAVIKVAETLGVDLPITTSLPIQKETSNEVDYKILRENEMDWKKVLLCLGYDKQLPTEEEDYRLSKQSNMGTMSKLVSIFDRTIPCVKCNRHFVNEISLNKHLSNVHNSKNTISSSLQKRYECGKCKRKFTFAINVRKHQWLCHRKNIKHLLRLKSFVEEETNINTSGKASKEASDSALTDTNMDKRARKKKALQEKMEDMTCKDCGLKCTSWKQLQIHTMDHSNERPFKCKLCQKGFKEPQKLKRHMVSHTREKQFSCKYCNKSFGLKHNMKTHEKIHEGGGHHCSYCNRTFSQSNTLQDHETKHRKLRHFKTQEEDLRVRQLLKTSRGRPSLKESFEKQEKVLNDASNEINPSLIPQIGVSNPTVKSSSMSNNKKNS